MDKVSKNLDETGHPCESTLIFKSETPLHSNTAAYMPFLVDNTSKHNCQLYYNTIVAVIMVSLSSTTTANTINIIDISIKPKHYDIDLTISLIVIRAMKV